MTTALRDHRLAPARVHAPAGGEGRYGRMLDLPPLQWDQALLTERGALHGP